MWSAARGSTRVGSRLLEWKWGALTNTLAYYDMELITTVKSFKIQGPGANTYQIFYSIFPQTFVCKLDRFEVVDFLRLVNGLAYQKQWVISLIFLSCSLSATKITTIFIELVHVSWIRQYSLYFTDKSICSIFAFMFYLV